MNRDEGTENKWSEKRKLLLKDHGYDTLREEDEAIELAKQLRVKEEKKLMQTVQIMDTLCWLREVAHSIKKNNSF